MLKNIRWRIAQFFELIWWKQYLNKKKPEEYRAWKCNYWHKLFVDLRPELNVENATQVMDLGCGPAGTYLVITDKKLTAVDPLMDEYENNLAHFNKADFPNATFIKSSMESFVPTEKADLIFCMNAINHVKNIDIAFDKLKECALPNATLVLSIDAHNYTLFKFLFKLIPVDILHPHQYDLKEYQQLLEKRGFKIIKIYLAEKHFLFNYYVLVASKLI